MRRYYLLPQKRLSSAAEIDEYVENLRAQLTRALQDHDAIQMN